MYASPAQRTLEWRREPARRGRRLRLVAFGGGTGLPILLAGLRDRRDCAVTAVVTVADDGGASGRLPRGAGGAPPGGPRRCLPAPAGGPPAGRGLRPPVEGRARPGGPPPRRPSLA